MRRECLDFLIPLGARQLRRTLQLWIDHYNRGRPHMSLGPGISGRLRLRTMVQVQSGSFTRPTIGCIMIVCGVGGQAEELWRDVTQHELDVA